MTWRRPVSLPPGRTVRRPCRPATPAVTALLQWTPNPERPHLPTPNYGYEKRQKELARRRKKEEKLKARAERKAAGPGAQATGDMPAEVSGEPGPVATAAPGPTTG